MTKPLAIKMIVALDDAHGIGKDGEMPWGHLPGDLARFKALTIGRGCVVGRKTFEGMPILGGRTMVVVTSQAREDRWSWGAGPKGDVYVQAQSTIAAAIVDAAVAGGPEVWVIGGAQVYAAALERDHLVEEIHVTRIAGTHDADTFFPWARVHELGFTCAMDVRGQDAGTRWQIWRMS